MVTSWLHKFIIAYSMIIGLLVAIPAVSQDRLLSQLKPIFEESKVALLSQYCNDLVELSIDSDKYSYSKRQLEFILKKFFNEYPPKKFDIIHEGIPKEGIQYLIANYTYTKGRYRIYLLIKQLDGRYVIDVINFAKS